jgi:hypothetical protein
MVFEPKTGTVATVMAVFAANTATMPAKARAARAFARVD